MGIKEFVLNRAKREGKLEGEKIGMSKAEHEKNLSFTKSLLSETDFTNEKIAGLVGVSIDFVQSIRKELGG